MTTIRDYTVELTNVNGTFEDLIAPSIGVVEIALNGPAGRGVPVGGTAAQALVKIDGTDYNTMWADQSGSGSGSIAAADITDSTAVGRAVIVAANQAAGRTAIGAGTSSFDGAYSSLSGAPSIPTLSSATPAALGTAAAGTSTSGSRSDHVHQTLTNVATATALQTGRTIDGVTFDGTANVTVIAPATHGSTLKGTPVDLDELAVADSAASFVLKKTTFSALATYVAGKIATLAQTFTNKDLTSGTNSFPTFNQNTTGSAATLTTARTIDGQSFNGSANITVIGPGTHAATSKTTPVGADELPITDSAASFVLKRTTITNFLAAAFASPTLTGSPTAPTQTAGDDSTKVATTAYVDDGLSAMLVSTDLVDAIQTAFPGMPQMVTYSAGWASNSNYTDASYNWIFIGGDDAHVPPTVAGQNLWIEP